ncbi:MAG: hypothetical protein CMJ73_07240 [Planctomycetaceae bacterium]|nr:hypothetical protein [Planctomycetaceae bacterium]
MAIVILRLMIGLHFFNEGASKLDGGFSSAGFLSNAKGPFAPVFRGMVWDAEGRYRLGLGHDKEGDQVIQVKPTRDAWTTYRSDVASYYRFDEGQKKESDAILKSYLAQHDWYVKTNREAIVKYFQQLERRGDQRQTALYLDVTSLRDQGEKLESELRRERGSLLAGINMMWAGLERELNRLATVEQSGRSPLGLKKLGRRGLDSITIDGIIPYFDLIVGICLFFGLFVPCASGLAALLLLSVIVTQWPGSVGAVSVSYQVIELCGVFVLAAMSAGHYAGVDYFIQYKRQQRGKKEEIASGQEKEE